MFGEHALIPGDRELTTARKEVYEALTSPIERAKQAGQLSGHSPELVAVAAWSLVHGLAALLINGRTPDRGGRNDPQQTAVAVTNLFARSVLSPPGTVSGRSSS